METSHTIIRRTASGTVLQNRSIRLPVSHLHVNKKPYIPILDQMNASAAIASTHTSVAANPEWAFAYQGTNPCRVSQVATDTLRNVYVVGTYNSLSNVFLTNSDGTSTAILPPSATDAAFLIKYSPAGNIQWATRINSQNPDSGKGVSTDGTYVYWCGRNAATATVFNASLSGGTSTTLSLPSAGAFLIKLRVSDGSVQWAARVQGALSTASKVVCTDTLVYITGSSGAADVFHGNTGTTSWISNVSLPATIGASTNAYLIKFASLTGLAEWSNRIDGSNIESGQQVAIGLNNEIYWTGIYTTETQVHIHAPTADGGTPTGHFLPISANVSAGVFLIKYDAQGVYQWATRLDGNFMDQVHSLLVVDRDGDIYWGGQYNSSVAVQVYRGTKFDPGMSMGPFMYPASTGTAALAFLLKYASDGSVRWGSRMSTPSYMMDADVDAANNLYIVGSYNGFSSSTPFYNGNITGGTLSDTVLMANNTPLSCFILKMSPDGVVMWATRVETPDGTTDGTTLYVDGMANIYIGGIYNGGQPVVYNAVGDATQTVTLPVADIQSGFMLKYNSVHIPEYYLKTGIPFTKDGLQKILLNVSSYNAIVLVVDDAMTVLKRILIPIQNMNKLLGYKGHWYDY